MVIVESHHEVLKYWAEFRASLDQPPRLITLDHHTDTSKPFRNLLKKVFQEGAPKEADAGAIEAQRSFLLNAIDFSKPETIKEAIEKLGNDEHIVTAIHSKIISSAFVIAHNAYDTDLATYSEHRIMCQAVHRDSKLKGQMRQDCDRVLEDSFLLDRIAHFNRALSEAGEIPLEKSPYILDIDLDYFNTFNSLKPNNSNVIRALAKNAGMISIAKEHQHVKNCSLDNGLDSDTILAQLMSHIS